MKTRLLTIVSLLLLLTVAVCHGAVAFSTPPNWLPMAMPGVTYNPTTNKLAAGNLAGASVLQTNTNASGGIAPGIASFDPASPISVLNGTAFSRRAGWWDPNEGDTAGLAILDRVRSVYGSGAKLWIDCLSKSAGLNTYLAVGYFGVNADSSLTVDYANPTGVPYSPIFGTPGSSTKWQWDGVMDHNTYSVPFSHLSAQNQPFSAEYKLYIGDAAGNELLVDKNGTPVASAAITTIWSWTGPPFVFTSQTGVAVGTLVESDVYTYTSTSNSDISVTGAEYAISTNGGTSWGGWTATTGTISNNHKVKVRQTSAPGHGVTTLATLAIPAVNGPGTFRVTTTTVPDPVWPVKLQDGFDQPTLAYAYSIAPNMAEPNNAVIMIKDGILANESSFSAGRKITVTLRGGYDTTFTTLNGITVIQGPSNVLTVTQGKVIVDKVYIRSTVPL